MTAREPYDLLAPFYDVFYDHEKMLELRQIVIQHTQPSKTLDAGAGTGLMGRYLAQQGYQVTLLDESERMLRVALHAAMSEGVSVDILTQSLLTPFKHTYDLIVASMDVVNHLPDLAAVKTFFKHAYDALKPQGVFIFDSLRCGYIQAFIGYQETLKHEGRSLDWHVTQGAHACSIEHHFKDGTHHSVIVERSYSPAVITQALASFNTIQMKSLNDRTVFIAKR